jgi:hypothetical protein
MDDLRRTLETEVIEPIFRGLAAEPHDASLPDVVFENRRRGGFGLRPAGQTSRS